MDDAVEAVILTPEDESNGDEIQYGRFEMSPNSDAADFHIHRDGEQQPQEQQPEARKSQRESPPTLLLADVIVDKMQGKWQEFREEVKQLVEQQVQPKVKQQVQQEMKEQVQQEVKEQIKPEVKLQVQREIFQGNRKTQQEHHRSRLQDRKWMQQEQFRARLQDRKWMHQEQFRARRMDRKWVRRVIGEETQPMQQQMTDFERRITQLENGKLPRNRKRVCQPRPAGLAPAEEGVPQIAERGYKKYSKDEDDHIVLYLVQHPVNIKHAKSPHAWEEARCDPVLAGRTAGALQQRFKRSVRENVMRGKYDLDPQILAQIREIWP